VDKVIVCDDGSSDLTGEIAKELGAVVITHATNSGKGTAIRDLFHEAKRMDADVIVTIDGDGQHDPAEIPSLVKPIIKDGVDIVVGSRSLGKNDIPTHRKLGGEILDSLTNMASRSNVSDTQSGFRAYSRRALNLLEVKELKMGVDSQLLIDAFDKGLKVVEVPIGVYYGSDSSTRNPIRHGVDVIAAVIRTVTERRPLIYLGVPGLVAFAIGLALSSMIVGYYNIEHYFSLPLAVLALGWIMVGLVLAIAAMILDAMNNFARRERNAHDSEPARPIERA
jgi:glycosyltransferase involved in cell wall biosynthesis